MLAAKDSMEGVMKERQRRLQEKQKQLAQKQQQLAQAQQQADSAAAQFMQQEIDTLQREVDGLEETVAGEGSESNPGSPGRPAEDSAAMEAHQPEATPTSNAGTESTESKRDGAGAEAVHADDELGSTEQPGKEADAGCEPEAESEAECEAGTSNRDAEHPEESHGITRHAGMAVAGFEVALDFNTGRDPVAAVRADDWCRIAGKGSKSESENGAGAGAQAECKVDRETHDANLGCKKLRGVYALGFQDEKAGVDALTPALLLAKAANDPATEENCQESCKGTPTDADVSENIEERFCSRVCW
eukprot:NODE_1896_length_1364_cov_38.646388_g1509_i1.p1 GENE.NODE_1896_length_1364_cov_38.646388_g1509_i1~~NODE_1896_length_1364_cov_38.646388_g1509_i1.p1  ORF type:complete len:303 (-),score=67.87 NODE_1896_length_1364_cov_38.646388_g1509_i1:120-1028(-)